MIWVMSLKMQRSFCLDRPSRYFTKAKMCQLDDRNYGKFDFSDTWRAF